MVWRRQETKVENCEDLRTFLPFLLRGIPKPRGGQADKNKLLGSHRRLPKRGLPRQTNAIADTGLAQCRLPGQPIFATQKRFILQPAFIYSDPIEVQPE